ncbi:MAG: adenylate/guanylate cyclase domain-containing protein [Spartobacteria bacterium]
MSDHDELENVAAAIAGLEAQRALLGNAVVDSAIRALRQQAAQKEAAEIASGDERKLVTILFSDISGFTALAEKEDPEKVRELINACFDRLVPIVQKYGGTVDKFIGDEIMALFGAPIAHEDDAERALRAALEMMAALAEFNRAQGTSLGLHFGINTGRVVAGEIGGQSRRDYSVMGDAVNLAARLEDASSNGEIFIGPTTYRLTSPLFEFEAVASLRLKGKEEPIEVQRLLGAKTMPKSTRGIEGLRASLVGRDREMTILREAVAALSRGEGKTLAIVGEAGLGKSRLLAETRASLPPAMRWAEGRALSYTSGMSYWLARGLLLNLVGIPPGCSPSEAADVLRRSVGEMEELFPYLARLLELPMSETEEDRVRFLSGEALRARIQEAMLDYVRAQASRQPLILVWEDLHWCDPSSAEIWQALRPLTRELPLLLLSAARLEEGNDRQEVDVIQIRLSPLAREESSSLIQELLQIESLPDHTRELLLNRAEGNPFFLEELLRTLIDAGVVVMEGNRAIAASDILSFEIPETVQGVLASRIDRLATSQKQVLQRASVIGRVFQERVLAQLYEERKRTRVPPLLAQLQERRFLQSHSGDEADAVAAHEYAFQHAITHEVAYGSMLHARRREVHQLVAEAIEQLFPERRDELAATLGYHFDKAESSERAAFYLGRAGDAARANFANTEAIAFYLTALRHAERCLLEEANGANYFQHFVHLNEGLGEVLTLHGEQEEACAAFARALERCRHDAITRSRLYRKIGFSHSLRRRFAETARAFETADRELGQEKAQCAPWWEEKVQIQLERMHLFYWEGMAAELRQLAARWREVVERRGTPLQRGKFFSMLALLDLTGSRYRPSAEGVKFAALSVSESFGSTNLSETAQFRFVLGFLHLWHGDSEAATEQMEEGLKLAERAGDLIVQARCLTYLVLSRRRLGQVTQTQTAAERSLKLAEKLQMPEYIAMTKANLAWVAWKEERDTECEALAQEALNVWHGMEDPYSFDWMALWPLIALALKHDDLAQATTHVRALLDENQHPMADEVTAACRAALDESVAGDTTISSDRLHNALQKARAFHYF